MKTSIIITLMAALPLLGQEAPTPAPECNNAPTCNKSEGKGGMHGKKLRGEMHKKMLEQFDTNKDGQLDDNEKSSMKESFEAKKAEMKQKFMEKFDANKDGQLDDEEKKAMREAAEARRGEMGGRGPRGPKGHGMGHGKRGPHGMGRGGHGHGPRGGMDEHRKRFMEKFDTNKDGQLDDEEKKAMREAAEARRGEMGGRGPRGPKGHGMGPGGHNKRGHWQGPRTKMPRNPQDEANKPATLEIPQE